MSIIRNVLLDCFFYENNCLSMATLVKNQKLVDVICN